MSQVKVPEEHRSKVPSLLRDLAVNHCSAMGATETKVLLDAAAEIEGSEEAYAVLVDQIRDLRQKLTQTQKNLMNALDLVARRSTQSK